MNNDLNIDLNEQGSGVLDLNREALPAAGAAAVESTRPALADGAELA